MEELTGKCTGDSAIPTEPYLFDMEVQNIGLKNTAVTGFNEKMSAILLEASNKIMLEAQDFNSVLLKNKDDELSKQMQRHLLEKEKLLLEIEDQKFYVNSLEACIERKELVAENAVEAMKRQQDLTALTKAFYKWHMYTQAKKKEKILLVIANENYETNLKRKVIRHWYDQLKENWKKRVELKANVEVLEMQKRIVNLYESKIKTLEESLSDAGRRIDMLLQSKLKLFDDSNSMTTLLHRHQPVNYKAQYYQAGVSNERQLDFEEACLRQETDSTPSLCAECSSQTYVGFNPRSYTYSSAPPVSYMQSQDQTKSEVVQPTKPSHSATLVHSLPIMGTGNYMKTAQTKEEMRIPKSLRPKVLVERHVSKQQPLIINPPAGPRPLSAKARFTKKVV